jgi:hypothetical protein
MILKRETGIEPATSRVERRSEPRPIPSNCSQTFIDFRGLKALDARVENPSQSCWTARLGRY